MPSVRCELLVFLFYLMLMSKESASEDKDTVINSTIDCMTATQDCESDFKCAFPMYRVFKDLACSKALGYDFKEGHITGAAAEVCPKHCGILIYNLTSLAKGKRLQTCECKNRDSICLTLKARLSKCRDTVVYGVRNQTRPGCTQIREQCSKDKNCEWAQQYFLRKCSRLISGVECSLDCKKAQKILLSSPLGRGLDECECDGLEEPHCRGIRAHQKALCFGVRVTKSVTPKYRPTDIVGRLSSTAVGNKSEYLAAITSLWLLRFLLQSYYLYLI